MENGEEINLYPRNSGAMSSSSEPMIFPVTALYLFVSRRKGGKEGGERSEEFLHAKGASCIGTRADGKHDRGHKAYQGFAP